MIEIWVPGKPQGKGRARAGVVIGKGGNVVTAANGRPIIRHVTPEKTRTYEGMIQSAAIEVMERNKRVRFEDQPLCLDLEIAFEVSASWPAWKRELALAGKIRPTVKPDSDNVEKAVKDALNGVVWRDDCQVVFTAKTKFYSATPGVRIIVDTHEDALPAQITKKPTPHRTQQSQLEI